MASTNIYDDAKLKPSVISKIKAKVRQEFGIAKDKLVKAEKEFSSAVIKHPKASVGVATGIGAAMAAGITLAIAKHKKKNKFQIWKAKVKRRLKKAFKRRRR